MASHIRRPLQYRHLMLGVPLGLAATGCGDDPGAQAPLNEPLGSEVQAVNSAPIQVRLHQFVIFNDNGSGTSLSTTTMQNEVTIANQAFAAAGVTFLFDSSADVTTINSTLLNTVTAAPNESDPNYYLNASARDHLSRKFPGKLSIFRMDLGGGFSSGSQNNAVIGKAQGAQGFTHELGHFFHLAHTFGADVTMDQARATIKNGVESGQYSVANGLQALSIYDGDAPTIGDTPFDLGSSQTIWQGQNTCTFNPVIAVTFTNGTTQNYTWVPNRNNIQSYLWCQTALNISTNQVARIRASLLTGNRARLRKNHRWANAWTQPFEAPATVSRLSNEVTLYGVDQVGTLWSKVGSDTGSYWPSNSTWFDTGYPGSWMPFSLAETSAYQIVFSRYITGTPYLKTWFESTGAYWPGNELWSDFTGGPSGVGLESGPVAASRNGTELAVAGRGFDGGVRFRLFDGSNWTPADGWQNLGGSGDSRPAIVTRDANGYDLLARRIDGMIEHRGWTSGSFTSPAVIGGTGQGAPAAVTRTGGYLDVLSQFPDGTVRNKVRNPGGGWWPDTFSWVSIGGSTTSEPVALTRTGADVHVFARWVDGSVRYKRWENGAWSPSQTGWTNLGGQTLFQPAAVSRTADTINLYVRFADGSIRTKVLTGATWSPSGTGWDSLGTPTSTVVPQSQYSCPVFNPATPSISFCSKDCPCEVGEGNCSSSSQCARGLTCVVNQGAAFGLPSTYDVCLPACPAYDPSASNGNFCTSQCPCDAGQGDCDSDQQCMPGLTCVNDVGAEYGLPSTTDVCR